VCIIFLIINYVHYVNASASFVPYSTIINLLVLWFGVSTPLVFFGSYWGFKKAAIQIPMPKNTIRREIPNKSQIKTALAMIMGGILPFGCIFIQLYFILNSIWSHQYYYMFGFLSIVYFILIITCSEITIIICYFQLRSEGLNILFDIFIFLKAIQFLNVKSE
jgi:transmembrane 9 superfamily protein 2/4